MTITPCLLTLVLPVSIIQILMKNLVFFTFLSLILFISGCGQTEVIGGTVATITIEPSSATLTEGYTTRFIATGRDSGGTEVPLYGNFYVQTTVASDGATIAQVSEQGNDGNKRYADILPLNPGIGKIECTYGGAHGYSDIVVVVGTIETIHVACADALPINNGDTATFIASGEVNEIYIYITPTWEVLGNIGIIQSYSGNSATFKATNIGLGTVEAFFGGKMGSKEVWVTGTTTADASSYVDQADDTPHDDEDYLKAAYYPGTESTKESYIHFDLSGIPPNTTIASAELTLTISERNLAGSDVLITCHKVTGSWTESAIKWSIKPSYNSTAIDSETVSTDTQSITFSGSGMISTIQDWVNNPSTNYGVAVIKKAEGNEGQVVFERTILNEEKRPKLTITF